MSAVGRMLFSPVGALIHEVSGKKKAPPQVPLQRPQAQTRSTAVLDAVAARRGSRANQRTGAGGVEAPAGKTHLGA